MDFLLVQFHYTISQNNNLSRRKLNKKSEALYNNKQQTISHIIDPGFGYPWNTIYKKEIVGNQKFDSSLELYEDLVFNLEYIDKCNNMCTLDIEPYHYTHYLNSRNNSLSHKVGDNYINNKIMRIELYYKMLTKYNAISLNNSGKVIANRYVKMVYSVLSEKCEKEVVDKIYNHQLYKNLYPYFVCDFSKIGIATFPIKYKMKWICMIYGRLIGIVKRYKPQLIERIK